MTDIQLKNRIYFLDCPQCCGIHIVRTGTAGDTGSAPGVKEKKIRFLLILLCLKFLPV